MSRLGIFMADGCEEIEGLTVVDLARRTGVDIDMISISDSKTVSGAHGIVFQADCLAKETDFAAYDGIILPGGMPGTIHLGENAIVLQVIRSFAGEGKIVAAICAAPSVLGRAGLLQGKHATSYPGFEEKMPGALYETEAVVKDGNIITSRGMGTAIEFAAEILRAFAPEETVDRVVSGIIYRR